MNNNIWISTGNLFVPGKPDKDCIIEAVLKEKKVYTGVSIDIVDMQKLKKFRRNDRFSVISQLGMDDMERFIPKEDDNRDLGTVFSTSFGPINTNLNFIKSIYDKYSVPSPTIFSHTVNNAALGHLCKDYRLKGPSTLLLSSNSIGVASKLLSSGKVKRTMVQGVEEYCEDLQKIYKKRQVTVNEAVARVILSKEKDEGSQSKIVGGVQANVWGHPLFESMGMNLSEMTCSMKKVVGLIHSPEKIDYVLVNSFDKKIYEIQSQVSKEINMKSKILNLYQVFGAVLGADLCSQLVVADMLIKAGHVARGHYCMINSLDISGNYITYLVQAE